MKITIRFSTDPEKDSERGSHHAAVTADVLREYGATWTENGEVTVDIRQDQAERVFTLVGESFAE